jgi:hypothetical protein
MLIPMTPRQADHAIAACEHIERGLNTAATRAQQAIQEAMREMQRMVEMINDDRAGRGRPPLDVHIKIPGDRKGGPQ